VAIRARILLMLADRDRPSHVAARLALSRNHVHYWVRRYVNLGVSGVVRDASRPGRKKRLTPERIAAIVNATLTTRPPGCTHWSTRRMARAQGVSEKTIRNIWHQHGLQPHRVTRFKLSKDPHFVAKLRDIVGLYLDPPERALVLCVDERARFRRWIAAPRSCPCRSGCRSAARMTIAVTARPHSLRRSTWRRGVSSASAIAVTAARSFSGF
jgi:transposase